MGQEERTAVVYRHGAAVQKHLDFLRAFTEMPGVRAARTDLRLEFGAGWVVSRLALVLDSGFSRGIPVARTVCSSDPYVTEFAGIRVERLDKATGLTGWDFIPRQPS